MSKLDPKALEAAFGALWPQQDWNGEEEFCRAVAEKVIRTYLMEATPPKGQAEAVTRIDILREWFGGERYARDYEYLDANFSNQAEQVLSFIRSALAPTQATSAERCVGCDGYNCDDGCAYPGAASSAPAGRAVEVKTLDEWHEDHGYAVWWTLKDGDWLGEPSYIGSPLCDDWPGYHTHWTPHPEFPAAPTEGK